jgi:hypothetical protein
VPKSDLSVAVETLMSELPALPRRFSSWLTGTLMSWVPVVPRRLSRSLRTVTVGDAEVYSAGAVKPESRLDGAEGDADVLGANDREAFADADAGGGDVAEETLFARD